MTTGFCSLVGAGPGDPGLITVKGLKRIREADIIVYDYLAAEALQAQAKPDAEMRYVGKKAGAHSMPQDKICELLVEHESVVATAGKAGRGPPATIGYL